MLLWSRGPRFNSQLPSHYHITTVRGDLFTHAPLTVTEQYDLISAKRRWCYAAGKINDGLATRYTVHGGGDQLRIKTFGREIETMHACSSPLWIWHLLPLFYCWISKYLQIRAYTLQWLHTFCKRVWPIKWINNINIKFHTRNKRSLFLPETKQASINLFFAECCNNKKTVCMVFRPKLRAKVVADVFPQFNLGTDLLQFVKESHDYRQFNWWCRHTERSS